VIKIKTTGANFTNKESTKYQIYRIYFGIIAPAINHLIGCSSSKVVNHEMNCYHMHFKNAPNQLIDNSVLIRQSGSYHANKHTHCK
jgi:hypothetical protein